MFSAFIGTPDAIFPSWEKITLFFPILSVPVSVLKRWKNHCVNLLFTNQHIVLPNNVIKIAFFLSMSVENSSKIQF